MDKDNNFSNGKGIVKIPEVRFNLKSQKDKSKATLILAVFRYGKNKLVYSTQHKIKPASWNDDKQLPKSGAKFYAEIKKDIDSITAAILDVYKDSNDDLQLSDFRNLLDIKLGRITEKVNIPKNFTSYFQDYIEKLENNKNLAHNTIRKFKSVLEFIQKFKGGSCLEFSDIEMSFKDDYAKWRYDNTKCKSQNTLNKDLEVIKAILKKSYSEKLHTNDIFRDDDFSIKRKQTSIFALNDDDITKLISFDFSGNKDFEIVRDWFVISCWSALRWSDFRTIKPEHIIKDGDDIYLKIDTYKTDTLVYIPINDKLDHLLRKYDFRAPEMENNSFNKTIKKVAEAAGLTDTIAMKVNIRGKNVEVIKRKCDEVSAHDARRTWATINYLKGYPIGLLMQVTGHSSEDMFLSYVGASPLDKARKLNEMFKNS